MHTEPDSPLHGSVADGKMQFENVAREWRCKWKDDGGGKASSKALVEIADLVDEYLPKLKALDGAVVNRAVCGGCLDFKLATTVAARDCFERTSSLQKAQSGGS